MVDGDSMVICMVQQARKALNKPFKNGVQQGNKVQNFTYHTITIAKTRFILPSIIEFFTIEFDGDVNGAWTSRCLMVIDASHISMWTQKMHLEIIFLYYIFNTIWMCMFRKFRITCQRKHFSLYFA